MPVQTTARSYTTPMPSFMSVFGEETNTKGLQDFQERHALEIQSEGAKERPATSGHYPHGTASHSAAFSAFHQHRGSTSTSASDSTESSPTTTISTIDSSSMTEPSPGPSPESPYNKVSPSSFVADLRPRNDRSRGDQQQTPFFELQRPTTPAKKARNLKNLAVNTSGTLSLGRAVSTATLPIAPKQEKTTSEPSSPAFVKPPTPPRRRPSALGLTIQTPANSNLPNLAIPPTPSFKRPNTLRHFQSSPSLPLCSPSVAPQGGMQLPSLRQHKPQPRGFAEIPLEEQEDEDQEPNFDVPQSREEKPAAYPNGPICIYESGVYLYFEPTAEVASNFDVIFNVASEVKNPFNDYVETVGESEPVSDSCENRAEPQPAPKVSIIPATDGPVPMETTYGNMDQSSNTPTTPKATPVEKRTTERRPEYIHIPWEHNTDIVPDLHKLVKVIDDRVQKGKRVLVHCQCGVSRSASLIVAYGLYKNPGISVQDAYDAVKKRSKWIGPNMNLIMQLQEFRSGLLKVHGGQAFGSHIYSRGMPRKLSPHPLSGGDRRASPLDREPSSGSRTPRTAPLPPEDATAQRASTGTMPQISPGPLSAPSGLSWSPGFRRSWGSSQTNFDLTPPPAALNTDTPYVDAKGHVVPAVTVVQEKHIQSSPEKRNDSSHQQDPVEVPRIPNFSRQLPLRQHQEPDSDVRMTEASPLPPPAISLRSTEFHMTPLNQGDHNDPFDLMSPHSTQFPTESSLESNIPNEYDMTSPRSTEFHMTGLDHQESNDPFGLLSPHAAEFPKDVFSSNSSGPVNTETAQEIISPRSTEFHMTPLKQKDVANDPYGLMSPAVGEFPKNPFGDFFGQSNAEREIHGTFPHRRPHPIHAIQPPQPQLQSLGSVIASSSQQGHMPSIFSITSEPRLSTSLPREPTTKLSAPPPHKTLRTKYSSPSISTQIKLHDLQTEIESHLPNRPPRTGSEADDFEALMSPRATELTKNPFHFEFPPRATAGHEQQMLAPQNISCEDRLMVDGWSTPKSGEKDPRSPPIQGVSPITRNIWDVL